MGVQFYDVKKREKVSVPENKLTKTTYTRTTKNGSKQTRYALRGELEDGRKVTKFVSRETWDEHDVPTE